MQSKAAAVPTREKLRLLTLTSLFTALTVIGAFIRIPLPLVPLSLQDFFVLLSGNILGPFFGALSQLLYLGLGLAGLPIFANGGGPAYVLQPTFGYLLGFPLASFVAGVILHGRFFRGFSLPERPLSRLILANAAGVAMIFTLGVIYLWLSTNFILGSALSFDKAAWMGCIVFLPGSALKLAVIIFLYRKLQARLAANASLPFKSYPKQSPAIFSENLRSHD